MKFVGILLLYVISITMANTQVMPLKNKFAFRIDSQSQRFQIPSLYIQKIKLPFFCKLESESSKNNKFLTSFRLGNLGMSNALEYVREKY